MEVETKANVDESFEEYVKQVEVKQWDETSDEFENENSS